MDPLAQQIANEIDAYNKAGQPPGLTRHVHTLAQRNYDALNAKGYWRRPENQAMAHALRAHGFVQDNTQGGFLPQAQRPSAPPRSMPLTSNRLFDGTSPQADANHRINDFATALNGGNQPGWKDAANTSYADLMGINPPAENTLPVSQKPPASPPRTQTRSQFTQARLNSTGARQPFAGSVSARTQMGQVAPLGTKYLQGVDGQMYPATVLPGGVLKFIPTDGRDPFAVPGTPVADDEAKYGRIVSRKVQGGLTTVVFADGGDGKPLTRQYTGAQDDLGRTVEIGSSQGPVAKSPSNGRRSGSAAAPARPVRGANVQAGLYIPPGSDMDRGIRAGGGLHSKPVTSGGITRIFTNGPIPPSAGGDGTNVMYVDGNGASSHTEYVGTGHGRHLETKRYAWPEGETPEQAQLRAQQAEGLFPSVPKGTWRQSFNEAVDETPQTLAAAGDAIGNVNKKVVLGGYDLVSNLPGVSVAYPQLRDPWVRNFVGNAAQDVGPLVVGPAQYLDSLARFYGAETAAGINALLGDKAAARQAQAAANQTGEEIVNGMTGGPNGAAAKSVRALKYLGDGNPKLAGATMQNVVNGIGKNAYEHPLQFAATVSMVGDGMIAVAEKAAAGMEYRAGLFKRAAHNAYEAGDTEAFHAATAKTQELQQAAHTLRNRINAVRKVTFRPTVPQKDVSPPERVAPRVAGVKPGTGVPAPRGTKSITTPKYVPGKAPYKARVPSQAPAPGDVTNTSTRPGAPPIPKPPLEQPHTSPSSGAPAAPAGAPRVSASDWWNQMDHNEFGATEPVDPHANISHVEMADGSTRFPGSNAHTDLNGHPIDPRQVVKGTDNNGNVIAVRTSDPASGNGTTGTPAPPRNPRALTNSELEAEIGRRQAQVPQHENGASPSAPTTANDQYLQALKQERVNRMFRTIYSVPPIEAGDTILDKQGNAWRATTPDQYGQVTVVRGGRRKTIGFGDVGGVRPSGRPYNQRNHPFYSTYQVANTSLPGLRSRLADSKWDFGQGIRKAQSWTGPKGDSVRTSIKSRHNTLDKVVSDALDLVDQVHGIGPMPEVPVGLFDKAPSRKAGEFTFNTGSGTGKIELKPRSKHLVFTLLQELGHSFDALGMGSRDAFLSEVAAEPIMRGPFVDEMRNILNADKDTRTYQLIKDMEGKTSIKKQIPGKTGPKSKYTINIDKGYVDYLLSPKERFARMYVQYIARKTQNAYLKERIAEKMVRPSVQNAYYPEFYSESDFDKIEPHMDKLLEALGWIK